MNGASIVFVVDDDPSVRSSLKFLLSTVGLHRAHCVCHRYSHLQKDRRRGHFEWFP